MKGLNGWMRLLEGSETAVLSTLIEELQRITDSDESSGAQLGAVILKDASLASSVIRIANSAQFNPGEIPVTTISRAILNIGFKNIRSFCMSLKLLETVLNETPSPLLVATLAKSLHSASQAKMMASHLSPAKQEEIYVASMMSHLAEVLVLSTQEEGAKELMQEIDAETSLEAKNKVAERTLGVSITRLAKTLMKQWRIDGLVNDVLSDPYEPDECVQAIQLGDEISRAAIIGWDSPEFEDVLKRVADYKDKSIAEVKKEVISTADEAAKTVESYGKTILNGHIPTSKNPATRKGKFNDEAKVEYLQPNQKVQLEILQRLTTQLMGEFNINSVFKSALTGLHQGVGLERVTLAIFEKGQQKLRSKYAEGKGTERWKETFELKYVKSHSGFLYNLFEKDQVVWAENPDHRHLSQYLTGEYRGLTNVDDFFIAPLLANGKRVGVIYADMGISKRKLTDAHFSGFCHFVQQVKLALTVLAAKSV